MKLKHRKNLVSLLKQVQEHKISNDNFVNARREYLQTWGYDKFLSRIQSKYVDWLMEEEKKRSYN